MRILIAGVNRAVLGGAEAYQRHLIAQAGPLGHAFALLHESSATAGRATVDGDAVPAWNVGTLGREAAVGAAAAWRPDVAYVQGIGAPELEALLLRTFPAVLFAHGYYGTCATGTKRHAWPRPVPCTRRLGMACLGLNYTRRCGGLSPLSLWTSYGAQRARHAMLQRYQGICVASRHMRKEYLRHGMTSESVHVTPLPPAGVSPDVSLAPAGVPSGVVLLVGRATELKAGPYLVDALSRAGARLRRALSLEIVGEGPALPALIARARRLGVPVSARPWAEPSQRNDRMRAAEVLLVPSTWPEPWGLVGLEAACVGLPSVAYAVGGIPEWLLAGESGELAPGDPPTAEGLAAALVRALGDRRHYERLRRGAWENSRRFTMERHLADLIPVLEGAARAGR